MTRHPMTKTLNISVVNGGIVSQGSYGLYDINRSNGVRRGDVIRVWHVMADGARVDSFLTRDQARDVADYYRRQADLALEIVALRRRYSNARADDMARRAAVAALRYI